MKECKGCHYYKKGKCKKLGFKVSINANWCEYYKITLINKIKKWITTN